MKIKIIYCCKDCGTKISYSTALYGKGRCCSCANKKENNPNFGKHISKKIREKISKAKKGKNHPYFGKHLSILHKEKISKSNKGHIVSLKTRKKISIANKGKKLSKEHRLKLSKIHKGKKLSKEICKKISEGHKGKNHPFFGKHLSKEHRKKLSLSHIGKKLSKEHLKKISGKNSPVWQGGISFFPYSIKFNKKLKHKIRERDNFTCQGCQITEKKHVKKFKMVLSVHHIDYNKQNCKESNLITLCNNCNIIANSNRDYWFAYYTYIIQHFVSKNK